MTIKSEAFKNAYAIFVSQKSLPTFKQIITKNKFEEVDIFKATFDNNTAMIVLPLNDQTKQIESILFAEANESEEGFWGQVGVGYKGKRWEKYV